MLCHGVQIVLVTSLLSTTSAYIFLDGYLKPNYPVDSPPGHPLGVPSPPLPPPLPPPPYFYRAPPPPLRWSPPVLPPSPVYLRGVFPPFIERIVQRIQTIWSVYNPPEELTRPPPHWPSTTTNSPKRKPSTTSTTTSSPPDEPAEDKIPTEVPDEGPVTTPASETAEQGSSGVSTLAVYEVTPSTEAAVVEPETTASPETTTAPEEAATPMDLAEDDTEDNLFITPERASLLSHKDAYLRYLQTGKVPPYLESDDFNEMDDVFT